MAERKMKIVVISSEGRATVYPKGSVDIDVPMSTNLQDILDIMGLRDDYELYIKVDPQKKLAAYPVDAIAILPAQIRPSRSVILE